MYMKNSVQMMHQIVEYVICIVETCSKKLQLFAYCYSEFLIFWSPDTLGNFARTIGINITFHIYIGLLAGEPH